MAQAPAPDSLFADATRAARLRFWIVTVGVLVIAAFAGSSAYDVWRSYHHVISATQRELGNMAKTLAEQAEGSLQTLGPPAARERPRGMRPNAPHRSAAADAKLAAQSGRLATGARGQDHRRARDTALSIARAAGGYRQPCRPGVFHRAPGPSASRRGSQRSVDHANRTPPRRRDVAASR